MTDTSATSPTPPAAPAPTPSPSLSGQNGDGTTWAFPMSPITSEQRDADGTLRFLRVGDIIVYGPGKTPFAELPVWLQDLAAALDPVVSATSVVAEAVAIALVNADDVANALDSTDPPPTSPTPPPPPTSPPTPSPTR